MNFKRPAQSVLLILFVVIFQFAVAKAGISDSNFADAFSVQKQDNKTEEATRKAAIARTQLIVAEIVEASFPELKNASIKIKTFESRADYLRARFSFSRFLTFRKLHYLIYVNPNIFDLDAPPNGIRAIIAHELAHVAYFLSRKRFELFGLVALQSKSFTARFERGADLQAIKRGYGVGLTEYREWLYANIPAERIDDKKREYFSPAEIDLILDGLKQNPDLMDVWLKKVPRNADEIKSKTAAFTHVSGRSPCGELPVC